MPNASVTILMNGKPLSVPAGSTVSAALLASSSPARISITGQPRTALCGMGICLECRAVVDGTPHTKTCQIACREGMTVETQQ